MTRPEPDPVLTAAALGVVWAFHAPGLDRFPWQLALADGRVVLLSADLEHSVVLPTGSDIREPDNPREVPLSLVPPAVLAAVQTARLRADRDEVAELLARRRQIAQVWGVDDVIAVRPDLTDGQAWAVLQAVDRTQDADAGITWATLAVAAESLFGPAPDAG